MLWGGRFARGPHSDMVAFTSSTDVDMRLLPYDVAATKAHARVLQHAGLLGDADVDDIDRVLNDLVAMWEQGTVTPGPADEDVHSLVERVLTENLGDAGRRIHAGRSRNDLVATDFRLWCRDSASEIVDALTVLIETIVLFAEAHTETVMPGYTHLQRAQPVSFGFHILAHGFAFVRDVRRFRAAFEAADVSALGAGALAGNTLKLDPYIATQELGVTRTFDNAMDAVSDRDFACDLLYACAMCATHMSRIAEEVVLWSTSEFGFIRLADDWSTGSSMMPQKRNPDVAELVRGRSAGAIADLTGLLTLIKGLPLAYDRDLQEDKALVFTGFDRTVACVRALNGLLGAVRFDKERMRAAASSGPVWATDLAEALVGRGIPFRAAHEKVGALVAELESSGSALTAESLKGRESFLPDDAGMVDPAGAIERRDSRGGTAAARVLEQVEQLKGGLKAALWDDR